LDSIRALFYQGIKFIFDKEIAMFQFYHFEGCPNSQQTLSNLKELVPENEIEIIDVSDLVTAEKYSFQGSPTILYKGIDLYSKSKPQGFHYSCRIYDIDSVKTGILSKEYIIAAIQELHQL
jgi:hypothetical protein